MVNNNNEHENIIFNKISAHIISFTPIQKKDSQLLTIKEDTLLFLLYMEFSRSRKEIPPGSALDVVVCCLSITLSKKRESLTALLEPGASERWS